MKKFCTGLLAAALLMTGGAVQAGNDHHRDFRSSYKEHRHHQGHGKSHWGQPHRGKSHHHGHGYQPRVQHHYHHYGYRPGYYGPPPMIRHRSGGLNGHVTIHF